MSSAISFTKIFLLRDFIPSLSIIQQYGHAVAMILEFVFKASSLLSIFISFAPFSDSLKN